jgi:protein-arginine kinase activator protein McsA
MNDEILSPFRRNDFKWTGKQEEENKSLKMRFKQAMSRLKESVRFDLEDEEYEESD